MARAARSPGCMRDGVRCLTHDLWEETGRRSEDFLASVSLADVLSGRLRPERSGGKAQFAAATGAPVRASAVGAPG